MGTEHLETFEFDAGEYHCKARALSIGQWENINERAVPFINAFIKEEVILDCLLEPPELASIIASGDIAAGIPLIIFDTILGLSGFEMAKEERDDYLEQARYYVNTSVIESCKVIILAAGICTLQEIKELSLTKALDLVALGEQVLNIRQQNMIAALNDGQPIKLQWESPDGTASEIERIHASKAGEVQGLINQQISSRYGIGARRL